MKGLSSATSRFISLAIALCSIGLVILLNVSGSSFLDLLELKTYDLRFQSRGALAPKSHIVLCTIDEKSLREEGRWPWPRRKIAKLVDILSEKGAKVIAFDIGFFEPDEYVNRTLIDRLKAKIRSGVDDRDELLRTLDKIKAEFNNDLILARSIRKSKARVVLGYFFHMSAENVGRAIDHTELARRLSLLERSKYPIVVYKRHGATSSPFTKAAVPVVNLELLTTAADSSGYFNIFPDPDGVVRRLPLAIQCGGDVYSPLAIQALWNALDRPPLSVIVSGYRVTGIKIGKMFIPTDPNGNLMINYLGPPKTFPHLSVTDVLNEDINTSVLKDSIVFVGATAVGIYDQRATPFSPVYPGLEVHATVADNILTGRYIIKPKWANIVDLIAICVLGLCAALFISLFGPYRGGLPCAIVLAIYLGVCTHLFWGRGIWLNIIYPSISLVASYSLLTIYHYVTQEREKRRLRIAFHHYVSPMAAKQLAKHKGKIRLGGEKKDLSVLFSDLRGFTKLSKEMAPVELVSQLNEYLTAMTDIVFEYGGTLDKYLGDGLMALFGAPIPIADHPYTACDASLRMIETLDKLNSYWVAQGKTALDVGIGISTGTMLVGNLGSRQRFDYTAIGEGVNLGARLERLTTYYGLNILISESTYEAVKERLYCVEIDSLRQTDERIIKIYCLVGKQMPPSHHGEALKAFSLGLGHYKAKDWKRAAEMFYNAYRADPTLRVAEIYLNRCKYLIKNPPSPQWDGVWNVR